MKKAQAQLIGYLLTILLGVIVVVSIIAILFYFYDISLRNEIRQGLKQIAVQISDSIVRLFEVAKASKAVPSNYSSVLISQISLNLPASISNRNYEIVLIAANPIWQTIQNFTIDSQNVSFVEITSGAKIIAKTTQDPIESIEYDVPNINVGLQGKSENGRNSKLSYYRYNINGTVYDKIVLGEADILINIENIS